MLDDLGDQGLVSKLIERHSDEELAQLMSNLGGHDLPSLLDAFETARTHDRPVCFIAYTIDRRGITVERSETYLAGTIVVAGRVLLSCSA